MTNGTIFKSHNLKAIAVHRVFLGFPPALSVTVFHSHISKTNLRSQEHSDQPCLVHFCNKDKVYQAYHQPQ